MDIPQFSWYLDVFIQFSHQPALLLLKVIFLCVKTRWQVPIFFTDNIKHFYFQVCSFDEIQDFVTDY